MVTDVPNEAADFDFESEGFDSLTTFQLASDWECRANKRTLPKTPVFQLRGHQQTDASHHVRSQQIDVCVNFVPWDRTLNVSGEPFLAG